MFGAVETCEYPRIMAPNGTAVAAMPPASRSAKTNGRRRFVDGDGRSPWARRWRDLKALYCADLGGEDTLSEFQLGLVGTAATLRCELERLEGRLSLGDSIDTDLYGRVAGHYRRICSELGIERKARDITPPTLAEIADEIHATREAETGTADSESSTEASEAAALAPTKEAAE